MRFMFSSDIYKKKRKKSPKHIKFYNFIYHFFYMIY